MNLRQNEAFSHIALIITIIILLILAGGAIIFVFGKNGVFTKVTADEVEYNKNEVLEELNTMVTEVYLESYKTATSTEGASIDSLYNEEIVIEKLKEKEVIENYKNKDGIAIENKYYIAIENFKRDVTKSVLGENGSEKNVFVLELKDNEYIVNYYNSKEEVQTIGKLQIEQNI